MITVFHALNKLLIGFSSVVALASGPMILQSAVCLFITDHPIMLLQYGCLGP